MRSLDVVWQVLGNPAPALKESIQLAAIFVGALASAATIIGSIYAFARWVIRKIRGKKPALSPRDKDLVRKLRDAGWANHKAGRHGPAIVAFDEAIRLHPNSGDAYKGRGFCRFARREFDLALADLNDAAAILPEDPTVFFCRARVFWALDVGADATADLQRVLLLRPGDPDAVKGLQQIAAANENSAMPDRRAPPPLPAQRAA